MTASRVSLILARFYLTHLRVGAKPWRRPIQIFKACPSAERGLAAGGMLFFVFFRERSERVVKNHAVAAMPHCALCASVRDEAFLLWIYRAVALRVLRLICQVMRRWTGQEYG